MFFHTLHLPHHLSFALFQMYFNIYFTFWHYFFRILSSWIWNYGLQFSYMQERILPGVFLIHRTWDFLWIKKLPYRSFLTLVRQSLYFFPIIKCTFCKHSITMNNGLHASRAKLLSRIISHNLYHYVWKHWFYYGLTYLFLYFFNFAPILHQLFCYIATFIFFISSDIWSSVTCTYKSIVTWIDECPSIFCNVFGCTPFSIHLVAKVCLNECI